MVGGNVSKETTEVKAVIDVDNAPPVPRASRKRAAPKAAYLPDILPTKPTKRQRLVVIEESSDEDSEPASKSTSEPGCIVTDGGKHTESPAKEMSSKGSGSKESGPSRSSFASRQSTVVRENGTVGHDLVKSDVPMEAPAGYKQLDTVTETRL